MRWGEKRGYEKWIERREGRRGLRWRGEEGEEIGERKLGGKGKDCERKEQMKRMEWEVEKINKVG